jgi:hypothetical protein
LAGDAQRLGDAILRQASALYELGKLSFFHGFSPLRTFCAFAKKEFAFLCAIACGRLKIC